MTSVAHSFRTALWPRFIGRASPSRRFLNIRHSYIYSLTPILITHFIRRIRQAYNQVVPPSDASGTQTAQPSGSAIFPVDRFLDSLSGDLESENEEDWTQDPECETFPNVGVVPIQEQGSDQATGITSNQPNIGTVSGSHGSATHSR